MCDGAVAQQGHECQTQRLSKVGHADVHLVTSVTTLVGAIAQQGQGSCPVSHCEACQTLVAIL